MKAVPVLIYFKAPAKSNLRRASNLRPIAPVAGGRLPRRRTFGRSHKQAPSVNGITPLLPEVNHRQAVEQASLVLLKRFPRFGPQGFPKHKPAVSTGILVRPSHYAPMPGIVLQKFWGLVARLLA